MGTPRFLVEAQDLAGSHALLTGAELRHLRVRRLRVGSRLVVTDGSGNERAGVIEELDGRQAVIRLSEEARVVERDSPLRLVLAQAFIKPSKLDLVIEKACELGASTVVVFESARTAAHVPPSKRLRWQRVAQSAAKQCQRSAVPAICGPVGFEEVLLLGPGSLGLLFYEGAAENSLTSIKPYATPRAIVAVVGPEGGFSASEVTRAKRSGFHCVGLGPRTLRAETAAIVALTLCQFLWGDLGSLCPPDSATPAELATTTGGQ